MQRTIHASHLLKVSMWVNLLKHKVNLNRIAMYDLRLYHISQYVMLCHAVGCHAAFILIASLYSHFPLQQVFLFEKNLPFVTPSPPTPTQAVPVVQIVGGLLGGVGMCIIVTIVAVVHIKHRRSSSCHPAPNESTPFMHRTSSVHYNTCTQEVHIH